LQVLADSSPRLPHSTTHRKIAAGVSCHSPRQISYAASPFSSLRLDSCREQAAKKTPDEEPAKKVHWGASLRLQDPLHPSPRKAAVNELVWLKPINPISVTEDSGSWG
jgi:hypothetical protein